MKNSRPRVFDGEDFSANLQYFVYTLFLVAALIFVHYENVNSFSFNWLELVLLISIFTPSLKFDDFYYYDDARGLSRVVASRATWVILLVVSALAISSLSQTNNLLILAVVAGVSLSLLNLLSTYQAKMFKLRIYRLSEVDEASMLANEGESHSISMKVLSIAISLVIAFVITVVYRLVGANLDTSQEITFITLNLIAVVLVSIFIIVNELFLKHRFGFIKIK